MAANGSAWPGNASDEPWPRTELEAAPLHRLAKSPAMISEMAVTMD